MHASSILLVGAGQIGSRYLQGLAAIDEPLAIYVLDTSEASLEISRQRLAQVTTASNPTVQFGTSLQHVPQHLDLALITTPANCRADVVTELTTRSQVKAWILEKVLAQNCVQLDQIDQALAAHKAWVNVPRRAIAWHLAIRSQLMSAASSPLQVRVSGGAWGLACNAIHFIDLVSWWTKASVASVNTSALADWVQSKRPGFYEVFGSLEVSYADGSELILCSHLGDEPTQVSVSTPQGTWLIEEQTGQMTAPSGQKLHGELTLQSALTTPLVKRILDQGYCELPTLSESIRQHRPFLAALLDHWNQSHTSQEISLPIT